MRYNMVSYSVYSTERIKLYIHIQTKLFEYICSKLHYHPWNSIIKYNVLGSFLATSVTEALSCGPHDVDYTVYSIMPNNLTQEESSSKNKYSYLKLLMIKFVLFERDPIQCIFVFLF